MKYQSFAGALALFLVPHVSFTQIIPADRSIDWSQSGIPGGIPNLTSICANVPATATVSVIQSALNSCPAGQVVKLAAGTYNLSGGLTIPSNVVLRGAGPQQTILKAAGSGSGFIRFGSEVLPQINNSTAVSAGANLGSKNLTLASSSGVTVGSYLMITQLNDPSYVTITTTNGSCTWCDGGIGWNGTRVQGQIVEVTSVSGNSVGINPGLYLNYTRTPLATRFSMGAKNAGVEDLQVYMNNTGYTANFMMSGTAYSWIKNVESNFTDGDHAQLLWSYRNEIRDSHFHDAYTHSPGSTDADIFLANKTSAVLIENNTLRRMHQSVMLNWGAAGNVIAYNYVDGNFDSVGVNTLFGGLNTHGAHPMFNLWEGNIAPKLDADYFWGSSSHNTAFRNWFKGAAQITPPLTGRGAEQTSGAYWAMQALAAVDISQTARYFNLVGNVIGSERQKSIGWTPQVVTPQNRSYYTSNNSYGYTFGYANLTDGGGDSGNSALAYTTSLIHGDYDFVKGVFRWDPNTSNHNVTSSLYLQGKPVWFGGLSWPAFGPDPVMPSLALVNNIPAKACFDKGQMPNCQVSSNSMPIVDTTPPNVPVGLTLNVISTSQINLSWSAASDNVGVTGYNIYRDSVLVGSSSSLSFAAQGLAAATKYSFQVEAYDAAGNKSAKSAAVMAATLLSDSTPPILAGGLPTGILAANTLSAVLSVNTNEKSTCRYSLTANKAYQEMTGLMTAAASGLSHNAAVANLTNGNLFTYYIRCQDLAANATLNDYVISFSVAKPTDISVKAPTNLRVKSKKIKTN